MSALPAAGRDEQVGTLVDLVRIPSVVGTAAEVGIVRHVADLLDGFEVDLWPIPVADLVARPDFPGMEVTRREAWGLVARLPGVGGGRSLMLNGHLDVVPPGDPGAWSDDPYSGRLVDGHVYGRGACDMKGGVVAALAAIRACGTAACGWPATCCSSPSSARRTAAWAPTRRCTAAGAPTPA
jgi:acetylornithine deacetylase